MRAAIYSVLGAWLLSACSAIAGAAPLDHAGVALPFVAPRQVAALRVAGATILDARERGQYDAGHIPGARPVSWKAFVEGTRSGRLKADLGALERAARALGVRGDRPVLVYGGWDDGWGEEGRVYWTLRYLGHPDVRILAGGFASYRSLGLPTSTEPAPPAVGDFHAAAQPALRATLSQVTSASRRGAAQVVDVRHRLEYVGATPYGSARGGHIPGALHFYWKRVFGEGGGLLPPAALRRALAAAGLRPGKPVILYCTGGVRAAFVHAALHAAGFARVRTFDGSWWEWAAHRELPVR